MSVYRDKKEWNKWNEMVLASEHAKEDFNDFADDRAVIQADKKIQSLLSKNYTLERQLAEAREELKLMDKAHYLCSQRCLLHIEEKQDLERQLEEAGEIIKGVDLYIEAECHEAWANNWEGREGAFVDIAKKLEQLKEKG